MPIHASIDIGSNTLLLLIVDTSGGGETILVDECRFGRLGQGLAESKTLAPEAVERSLAIVREFRALMDQHPIDAIACVGTQALREAQNSRDFVEPAKEILGVEIEIISGEREAELTALAIQASFPELCASDVVVVDVGGASTEFIRITGNEVVSKRSLPIGAVKLSESFLRSDPPAQDESRAMFAAIDEELSKLDLPQGLPMIGSAGSATSIASIKLRLDSYQPDLIHGQTLSPAEVAFCLAKLLAMPVDDRRELKGLEAKRADVIPGGVAIFSRVLERFKATSFTISDRGVRWGLLHELDTRARE